MEISLARLHLPQACIQCVLCVFPSVTRGALGDPDVDFTVSVSPTLPFIWGVKSYPHPHSPFLLQWHLL